VCACVFFGIFNRYHHIIYGSGHLDLTLSHLGVFSSSLLPDCFGRTSKMMLKSEGEGELTWLVPDLRENL
jgi:hypothetical protein